MEEEIAIRRRAFHGFVAAGDPHRAAYAAWMLSVRHRLRDQPVEASGWLQRAHGQIAGHPFSREHGYLECSAAEQALSEGRYEAAGEHAARAVDAGRRFADPELSALGLTWQGLSRLAGNDAGTGLRLLDEAMSSVTSGELDAHFTGWVYCFAIGICMGIADLRRAGTWAQQAWDWASSLPEPTPYRGLCRVRQVEVMGLRGELKAAEAEAQRACEEMLDFEPKLAGEAFYVAGEILQRRGDLPAANQAFKTAQDLGHDPQPGLALLRLAEGRAETAAAALRVADPSRPPFRRAALLAARVEVELAAANLAAATQACEDLDRLAGEASSDALSAAAATARGRVLLAESNPAAALPELRSAVAGWRKLDLAYEVAGTRALIGTAMQALGDREGASRELEAARRTYEELGARTDAHRVAALSAQPLPGRLTARECEVLGLVAAGSSNRQIAGALTISEHTVARHLSNIFTKLGVSSRTAAAAFAFEHDLVPR